MNKVETVSLMAVILRACAPSNRDPESINDCINEAMDVYDTVERRVENEEDDEDDEYGDEDDEELDDDE